MSARCDIAILGGGCAGLSLAWHLCQQPSTQRIIIIEPRREYEEDRTWCGWPLAPHPFDHCVVARWHQWTLTTTQGHTRVRSPLGYEMISAQLFYDTTRAAIDAAPHVTLWTGVRAGPLEERDDEVIITLDNGQTLAARQVIDTRPRATRLAPPWRWQDFAGRLIESPQLGEDATAELMNFAAAPPPDGEALDFVYLLPTGDHTALVEWTRFGRAPTPPGELDARLMQYIDQRFGKVHCLRQEAGTLPMAPADGHHQGRILHAGTAGGAMRPATGYAFHAIQRWALDCSTAMIAGKAPTAHTTPCWLLELDRIYMTALSRYPDQAPEFYRQLFARLPAERVIRFLAGQPTFTDVWRVMSALPPRPFLSSAAHLYLPLQSK
ncbi:lycopene cyclase family protein [Larsenimonas rhizosphaerae]|uniref:Lycopene cyclase family protein n=1 Tax=Larsenimonas rhizosphaerae TaxID=2944682 RepID=A0AA42CXF5_9GAMM|nr:lycopene cyclase family protein [Larsenimonas rhizosphaerae]MCX2523808.1 lycopene cyclase family protein [Larsenimonas rhizosphaerae]